MKLSELGEFGLIDRFSKQFIEKIPVDIMGIGDDCAVIPVSDTESLVVTTDLLVENSHFLLDKISPFELGYKSLAVNLSDIAAMGALPHSAFLSIALTKNLTVEWVDEFFRGIQTLCEKYNCLLLGGDTTKSEIGISINFTVIGKGKTENLKFRKNARPGDLICINNITGDSGGGLKLLLEGMEKIDNPDYKKLISAHNFPEPDVFEGEFIASFKSVNAMMDISDGIDSDIRRIIKQSGCGAIININKIPISDELKKVSDELKWNAVEIALTGGEDYSLLFTINPDGFQEFSEKYYNKFGSQVYIIGEITNTDKLEYRDGNKMMEFNRRGFDHFNVTNK